MSRLFSDIDSIQVISINNYQGEFQNIDACGIFIMTSDTYENHQRNENSFNVNQNQILRIRRDKYELRFVSVMKVNRNNKYEEIIFARHRICLINGGYKQEKTNGHIKLKTEI